MKKTLAILLLSASINASAQNYYMSEPFGYGAGVTGGGNATPETVSTYEALKAALASNEPKVILVSGTITFPKDNPKYSTKINSNKTLIGLPGAKLEVYPVPQDERNPNGLGSHLLTIDKNSGVKNIIIRNLIFQGPGAWDAQGEDCLTNDGGTDIWIDHCEFYDGMDGNIDMSREADNITFSWCKFGYTIPPKPHVPPEGQSDDHRFSNLVAYNATDAPTDGRFSITFAYNYWSEGCVARMPRARNAQFHFVNCYYNSSVASEAIGLEAGINGTESYVENCHFEKLGLEETPRIENRIYKKFSSTPSSTDPDYGNPAPWRTADPDITFVNCLRGASTELTGTIDGNAVAKPYEGYSVLPVAQVKAVVTGPCGAGATLQVSPSGEISSPCGTQLAAPENVHAQSTTNSATVTWSPVNNAAGYKLRLCENSFFVSKEWDFAGDWGITAESADANLVADVVAGRFNYALSTNNEELTFANGTVIPFLAGLKFMANANNLTLGYATKLLYLRGVGTQLSIPCAAGDVVKVEALSGNVDAIRGFTVLAGEFNQTLSSANIENGLIVNAGETATFAYNATGDAVVIATTNGMNIKKITIETKLGCNEVSVGSGETSYTFSPLTNGTTYSYQVQALGNGTEYSDSPYSTEKLITIGSSTGVSNADNAGFTVAQMPDKISISGADIAHLTLYTITGAKAASSAHAQQIGISALPAGLYILLIETIDGTLLSEKIIKR
ncbi:MAG: hypothetical protein LBR81_08585 [Prevotellaceae bacterium]|jgi:pectate lyase|nr:hypothetical protein [Prevotellaceae bacterium]